MGLKTLRPPSLCRKSLESHMPQVRQLQTSWQPKMLFIIRVAHTWPLCAMCAILKGRIHRKMRDVCATHPKKIVYPIPGYYTSSPKCCSSGLPPVVWLLLSRGSVTPRLHACARGAATIQPNEASLSSNLIWEFGVSSCIVIASAMVYAIGSSGAEAGGRRSEPRSAGTAGWLARAAWRRSSQSRES